MGKFTARKKLFRNIKYQFTRIYEILRHPVQSQ